MTNEDYSIEAADTTEKLFAEKRIQHRANGDNKGELQCDGG